MLTCEDYEGEYTVSQTSCTSSPCKIPAGATVRVRCETPPKFEVEPNPGVPTTYDAEINTDGQLVVEDLELVASVTGSEPNRYLFGVAMSAMMTSATEVWGAEQG